MTGEKRVIATQLVETKGHTHHEKLKLADGAVVEAADAIREIDDPAVHVHYTMIPPEGAPAYAAHQEAGLPLELQVRPCPDCGERTLFA
jgi:hypothetical protein